MTEPGSAGVPAVGFDGRDFARQLPRAPGVYRMLAADGSALYVGKAASLRQRVGSYFSSREHAPRIAMMLARVAAMEVTVTRTEAEALILENQLIKSLRPKYNVLLRDDKSYPFIRLTAEPFPRVMFYRGSRQVPGRLFGPYAGVVAVRESLNLLHRLFRLRSCEDSVFRGRSRPCLQYQIGRCSAPCVGLIEPSEYAESVRQAVCFLEGKGDALVDDLAGQMERAAQALKFEQAARLRDLIASLRATQAQQFVDADHGDLDVLALCLQAGQACVLVLSFRAGMNYGTRSFFPKLNGEDDGGRVLAAFVTQHYLEHAPPREIVLSQPLPEQALIEQVLAERAGHRVQLKASVRGDRARYLELAQRTAATALAGELGSAAAQQRRLDDLQQLLDLAERPRRIECFDISHTQGEATVASCVVFDAEGPRRSDYRRFNIQGITPGDDYAAMQQALQRRFVRGQAEGVLPDLLLIDGGRGQLAQALAVLAELGIHEVRLLAVAKGEARKAGQETLIFADGRQLQPGPASPGLQLIQQVRDEAHRFAITGHRGRRAKARTHSRLEDVEGIGPRRRVKLLRHFGGLAGLKAAGIEEIARVEGINAELARRIYGALHEIEPVPGQEQP